MGQIREQLMRQRQVNMVSPPNVNYPLFYQQLSPGTVPTSIVQPMTNNSNYSVSPKPVQSNSGWFFSLPGRSVGDQVPKIDHLVPDQRQHDGQFAPQHQGMVGKTVQDDLQTQTKPFWFGGERLTRRPLRQETTSTHISKPESVGIPSVPATTTSSGSSIKSKFMTAFGLNSDTNLPPGLKNNGMNLCFVNAILQSLARTPHLVSYLMVDALKDLRCGVAENVLLSTLAEVLHQCSLPPEQNTIGVLDPVSFRQAASTLNGNLFAPMGRVQDQQDAAEFLMWLLETIHTMLNNSKKARQNGTCCT